MSNDFYNRSTNPAPSSSLSSEKIRGEFKSIQEGFDKLPRMTGYGSQYVAINAAGTALEPVLAPSGTLPTQSGQNGKFLTTNGTGAYWKLIYSEWKTVSSNYTALDGDRIRADTSGGSWTLTLPYPAADGAQISVIDYSGSFAMHNLIVYPQSAAIASGAVSETMTVSLNNFSLSLVYCLTSNKWRFA